MSRGKAHPGSFRDPAGFIFTHNNTLYRQVNKTGQTDFDLAEKSGLYGALIKKGLLTAHKTAAALKGLPKDPNRYKIIKPQVVPFISYPYEWTFDQLKDAALITLKVQKIALRRGMILKDASAYNVQFIGNKPILIDSLSFKVYKSGDSWEGYKQFCEHFIAPLALAHYSYAGMFKILRSYLDGIPLDTACKLLPTKARLQRGLAVHLYLHASAQRKHKAGGKQMAQKTTTKKMSNLAMEGLLASLERTIKKLSYPRAKTEWGQYYSFTNYSSAAFKSKRTTVEHMLSRIRPKAKTCWDIGANNGEFSTIAAHQSVYTVAFDVDETAVNHNYLAKRPEVVSDKLLPLVMDLANPSPGLGWAHRERASLKDRGPADVVLALALIHHLAIGNNLPLPAVASFLRQIGKNVIIEFVPKDDSKVKHLLASRKDIFDDYDAEHFEQAMAKHFGLVEKLQVKNSKRSVYLYRRKS